LSRLLAFLGHTFENSSVPTPSPTDLLVVGANLDGLACALDARRAGQTVLLVDESPRPGGRIQTQRSEGFVCEYGPFALPRSDWDALAQKLRRAPAAVGLLPGAENGFYWNGRERLQTPVGGDPVSGAGGLEDLVTAFRRELDDTSLDAEGASEPVLQLGREVTALAPGDDGTLLATLGGESPRTIVARSVDLFVPLDRAARLLAPLDPALPDLCSRFVREPEAMCFVGYSTNAAVAAATAGYGVVVEDMTEPLEGVEEVLFCTSIYPRRAQPGKSLVRIAFAGTTAGLDDEALLERCRLALQRMTKLEESPIFFRCHRATRPVRDSVDLECRVRLRALDRMLPNLHWRG
jgi:protoporphyrinogen oxidase